jgi:hypothetical protein
VLAWQKGANACKTGGITLCGEGYSVKRRALRMHVRLNSRVPQRRRSHFAGMHRATARQLASRLGVRLRFPEKLRKPVRAASACSTFCCRRMISCFATCSGSGARSCRHRQIVRSLTPKYRAATPSPPKTTWNRKSCCPPGRRRAKRIVVGERGRDDMRTVFIGRHPICRAKNGRSRHFEFCRSGPIAEVTDLMKHCGYRGRRDRPICLPGEKRHGMV